MYKTKNLGLNITEIEVDKLQPFSFDIDLGDNFKAIDEKTVTHRNITNCILEIPQDIKLELKDGVLTLKEGSVLYKPNGANNFEKITINTDVSRSDFDTASNQMVIFYNTLSNSFSWYTLNQNIYSGDVAPTNPITQSIWYDTANNVFKYTGNAGVDWTEMYFTMPIAIVTRTNGVPTSIDQVFNGFGYIGSTAFVLPGVKGIIPNGRNEDGSLNNTLFTTQVLMTRNYAEGTAKHILGFNSTIFSSDTSNFYIQETQPVLNGWWIWLNPKTNRLYHYNNDVVTEITGKTLCALYVQVTNAVITSFDYKPPFQAVDYYDYSTKIAELEAKIQALQVSLQG